MARGRPRHQRGSITITANGGWQISYYVYLRDPFTKQEKRYHRSRVVGHKRSMCKTEVQRILSQELGRLGANPSARPADGNITFGEWMRKIYIPMRGANWRDATRFSNEDYLKNHIYPEFEHLRLKDITKFRVQMFINRTAEKGYAYTVVYHVRDLIKAALAEAVDQDVIERNVARKTFIPEISEREKHLLPVEMYSKLSARVKDVRDRAIILIGCFCALRPSELFGLTWESYQGDVFKVMNTAWRGRFQPRKIKRKNLFGRTNYRLVAIPRVVQGALELWRAEAPDIQPGALIFPAPQRAQFLGPKPMISDNWLRLRFYPVAKEVGLTFNPSFQVLRRSFSTHGKQAAHPTQMQAQLGHSDVRTTLDIYTQTLRTEVIDMVNAVTDRLLGHSQALDSGQS